MTMIPPDIDALVKNFTSQLALPFSVQVQAHEQTLHAIQLKCESNRQTLVIVYRTAVLPPIKSRWINQVTMEGVKQTLPGVETTALWQTIATLDKHEFVITGVYPAQRLITSLRERTQANLHWMGPFVV